MSTIFHGASGLVRAWLVRTAACCLTLSLLAACGGGTEVKVGSNGSGLPPPPEEQLAASAALTSLGPMDIAGSLIDEAGVNAFVNATPNQTENALRLGMTVDLAGKIGVDGSRGSAASMQAQSAVVGPIAAIDRTSRTMRVLGITARVDVNTLFDGVRSLDFLNIGDRIEVYGLELSPSQTLLATRVARLPSIAAPSIELMGIVSGLSSSALATVGGVVVNIPISATSTSVSPGPACSANCVPTTGSRVRILGQLNSDGSVTASQLITGLVTQRPEGHVVVMDGIVTQLRANGNLLINNEEIDVSAATFPVGGVAVGSRVQVRGRKTGGVIRPNVLTVVPAAARILFTVEGDVSGFTSLASFVVRGERINASTANIVGGIPSDIVNGRRVRVQGFAGEGQLDATVVTLR